MTLQEQLDTFKAAFETQAPAEAINAFERSIVELIGSRQAERTLKAGDRLPDFILGDSNERAVSSRDLLAGGPMVLTFYRGAWCPYCNIELRALEEAVGEITARGAQLVAVSMHNAENNRKARHDNNLSYPILTDFGGALADKLGIRWVLPDYLAQIHKSFKVELPVIHNDGKWTLPMPARYVVAQDGTIVYAEVTPDYTSRPEPSDLFPILDQLAHQSAA